jgi:hypothetical protein
MWLRTKSTVQQGFVSPSAQPLGAGSSGDVTCQMPLCTDSQPARVQEVSPAATMSAAAQSAGLPPPVLQSFTMAGQGIKVPSAYGAQLWMADALARVELVL